MGLRQRKIRSELDEEYEPGAMTARGVLSGRCFSAPAFSGGLLYLRNEEQLLCLDLRFRVRP